MINGVAADNAKLYVVAVLTVSLWTSILAAQEKPASWMTEMQKVYSDENHCLTAADMRGNEDMAISCYCRDAIADARYVYHTYLLPGKDRNLGGPFLVLLDRIGEKCGKTYGDRARCPSRVLPRGQDLQVTAAPKSRCR